MITAYAPFQGNDVCFTHPYLGNDYKSGWCCLLALINAHVQCRQIPLLSLYMYEPYTFVSMSHWLPTLLSILFSTNSSVYVRVLYTSEYPRLPYTKAQYEPLHTPQHFFATSDLTKCGLTSKLE